MDAWLELGYSLSITTVDSDIAVLEWTTLGHLPSGYRGASFDVGVEG